ncbi:sulfatase [Halomicrobium salinisoli]|uniref:sulfatase n=1 Tax=Halomicrobium salinisoli TaxID=2878391 RepID=UPI001CF095FE|nr:sulfatase [Halomicrobium salinisoli]
MDKVLLLTIDSLRAGHVGYHGYERDTTPNIDALAADGSRFTSAFAHAGSTKYSFPGILTSVTPLSYGGYDRVSERQTVVSEAFDEAGYRTGGFHSNLFLSADFGYDRGWDEFFDSSPDESFLSKARRFAKVNLEGTPVFSVLQRGYDFIESSSGVNVGSYHVPADDITDRAIDFLDRGGDEPTFLWVHYMDVHHPFLPPEEYQLEFRDDVVSDQESIKLRRKCIEEPENVTEEERETLIDLYDAEILFNDAEIGRLVEAVEDEWDDYLLALTSDHGDHFLERGYFGGADGYDIKTHVPLFVSGWDDEGSYDDLVGLSDVPPTLLDAADLPAPDSYQGHSLRGLVESGDWPREEVFGGWNDEDGTNYVVREPDWKFIQFSDGREELYYLPDDPDERDNLVDERADERSRLDGKLDDHRSRIQRTSDEGVARPDVNEDVKERLRRLGYDE